MRIDELVALQNVARIAARLIDNAAECLGDHGGLAGPTTIRDEDHDELCEALKAAGMGR